MKQDVPLALSTEDERIATFAPYINAAGEVVNAWNRLQEQLKYIFATITGMSENMAYSIWHSARSDSLQRDILRAAITNSPNDTPWVTRHPNAKDDLLSLLNKADKLAEKRNDAIHAPVSLAFSDKKLIIVPFYFNGNPRANNLKGKDIISEFKSYCADAYILMDYADKAENAINLPSCAWPDRPTL